MFHFQPGPSRRLPSMPSPTRTQEAVLRAAIRVWGRDSQASLGQVAAEAGLGRTTVHRTYPDRAALVSAVDHEVREIFAAAARRARIEDGSAPEALARLVVAFLDLGDPLRLVLADAAVVDPGDWHDGEASHPRLTALFRRGVDEGHFDPHLDPEWMVMTMWLLLYGAWLLYDQEELSLRDAHWLLLRTVENAVRRPPDT